MDVQNRTVSVFMHLEVAAAEVCVGCFVLLCLSMWNKFMYLELLWMFLSICIF